MKIIFLNVWHGKNNNLFDYISSQANSTDIFCFQEAFEEMRQKCGPQLSNFRLLTGDKKTDGNNIFSLATYVRDNIKILDWCLVLPETAKMGLGIYTEIDKAGHKINLCNFHGTSYPGEKIDTSKRLQQSEGVLTFFDKLKGLKIIGGDFNLNPETKSIDLFEENGFRNLIEEHRVPTTRNELAWNRFPGPPYLYSDYVFVSQDVGIKDFTVSQVLVSDHLPLVLEIEP